MFGDRTVLSSGLLVLALASQGQQAPRAGTGDVVARFWQRVAKAKTITYTAREWLNMSSAGPTPPGEMHLRSTFEVKVQRPNLISVVGSPPQESETTQNGQRVFTFSGMDSTVISDGKRSIRLSSVMATGMYHVGPPITFLSVGEATTLQSARLAWVFSADPLKDYHRAAGTPPQAYGAVTRSGSGAGTIIYTSAPVPRFMEIVWFDRKTGELLRLSYFGKTEKDEWKESMRTEFHSWDFDAKLPGTTFDTKPPKGYHTMKELQEQMKARQKP